MVWRIDLIWNVNYVRATSFIFDTRMDVLVKGSMFLGQKMSQPKGDFNLCALFHFIAISEFKQELQSGNEGGQSALTFKAKFNLKVQIHHILSLSAP